jgi:hypothetical protein
VQRLNQPALAQAAQRQVHIGLDPLPGGGLARKVDTQDLAKMVRQLLGRSCLRVGGRQVGSELAHDGSTLAVTATPSGHRFDFRARGEGLGNEHVAGIAGHQGGPQLGLQVVDEGLEPTDVAVSSSALSNESGQMRREPSGLVGQERGHHTGVQRPPRPLQAAPNRLVKR